MYEVNEKLASLVKQIFFIVLILFHWGQYCLAQETQFVLKSKDLNVGDVLPNYTLTNLINYPSRSASISDFKGKFLILDFWNSGCKGCIESWPKLLEVQRRFEKEIQIVLVNPWQDESVVRSVFEKRKRAGVEVTLPTVCQDSALLELFHISGLPHVVWVDLNHRIVAVTDGLAVNENNIQNVLEGKVSKMPKKINNDEIVFPNLTEPLFIDDNGGAPVKTFGYSFFGKASEYVYPGKEVAFERFIDRGLHYAYCINRSIYEMYQLAYEDGSPGSIRGLQHSRVFWDISAPSKYFARDERGEIMKENLYSYQLILKRRTTREQLKEVMREDLRRYVGLNARMEKRKIKCLVFSAADTILIQYRGGGRQQKIDDLIFSINDLTMRELIDNMYGLNKSYANSPYPIIDETNFKGRLGNITFEGNATNYLELDKGLRKYGVRLTLQEREVSILVVSEPEGYVFPY